MLHVSFVVFGSGTKYIICLEMVLFQSNVSFSLAVTSMCIGGFNFFCSYTHHHRLCPPPVMSMASLPSTTPACTAMPTLWRCSCSVGPGPTSSTWAETRFSM